jgi:predicted helicase
VPLGLRKRGLGRGDRTARAIFDTFSNGNDSGRDVWVYNFKKSGLLETAQRFADRYNSEIARWQGAGCPVNLDSFLITDERQIKWTRNAKRDLRAGKRAEFDPGRARVALYHPFSTQWFYPGKIYNKEVAQFPKILPTVGSQTENVVICVPGAGNRKEFGSLATNLIPTLDVAFEKIQCFPFYTYDDDGRNRQENVTDWALGEFRKHYRDETISKWDIFHYTYGVLHHPEYRTRYVANLKRELPRIPMAREFRRFAEIGAALMKLHVEYERQPEYTLERREEEGEKLNWRVVRMTLSKDKTQLKYNDFLTLTGIPAEAYEYRLGNRSALEWVVNQYRVTTDKRSGIVNDPNRDDDPEYIVRLICQVTTVSLETVRLVRDLSALPMLPSDAHESNLDGRNLKG